MRNLDYGIIGNCQSAALISLNGSIDWCCLPDFDSPSVFARLLDENKGGHFSIIPEEEYIITQKYADNTNILITNFTNSNNEFEIIDFMPRYKSDNESFYVAPEIYRYIVLKKGKPKVTIDYKPQLNYAKTPTRGEIHDEYIKHFTQQDKYYSIYLYTNLSLELIMTGRPITIEDDSFFLISFNQKLIKIDKYRVKLEYHRTMVYWMNWASRTRVFPKYQNHIQRSALLLKLLSFHKTGAIIAAPTTSLPETIGDERNWDYRFSWIRDSSMIIKTLLQIGHIRSAKMFQNFILNLNLGKHEDIQIMYGIRGEKNLQEIELNHLSGYENSRPVRIGNGAFDQRQNDSYGVLIDTIYLSFLEFPSTLDIAENLWSFVRDMLQWVENNYQKKDKGIWEIRGEPRHFVYSKIVSWLAADRAEKIARLLERKYYMAKWKNLKDKIRKEILANAWDNEMKSFVQSYYSKDMDASNLLIAELGFLKPQDPKFVSTVLKTKEILSKNGYMFRYLNNDGLGKPESSFILCNFWLINALYHIGHKQEAEELFNNMILCTNHLGLLSEHIDIDSKRLLGNFPQGYSHIGLIQSALILNGHKEIHPNIPN